MLSIQLPQELETAPAWLRQCDAIRILKYTNPTALGNMIRRGMLRTQVIDGHRMVHRGDVALVYIMRQRHGRVA